MSMLWRFSEKPDLERRGCYKKKQDIGRTWGAIGGLDSVKI